MFCQPPAPCRLIHQIISPERRGKQNSPTDTLGISRDLTWMRTRGPLLADSVPVAPTPSIPDCLRLCAEMGEQAGPAPKLTGLDVRGREVWAEAEESRAQDRLCRLGCETLGALLDLSDRSFHLHTTGVIKTDAWLPWWLSGEESVYQCGRHRFDP